MEIRRSSFLLIVFRCHGIRMSSSSFMYPLCGICAKQFLICHSIISATELRYANVLLRSWVSASRKQVADARGQGHGPSSARGGDVCRCFEESRLEVAEGESWYARVIVVLWFGELCGNRLHLAHEFLAGASLNPRFTALVPFRWRSAR